MIKNYSDSCSFLPEESKYKVNKVIFKIENPFLPTLSLTDKFYHIVQREATTKQ